MKHDASKVMELEKEGDHYVNTCGDRAKLEDEMMYGLLKSADLKGQVLSQTRKFTIVTQQKVR